MPAPSRRVALPEFLLEQGCFDPKAAAPYLAKIATGKLAASVLRPAVVVPSNPSFTDLYRYGMHPEYGKEKEISVLSIPNMLAEVQKAARGLEANWTMIDTLVLSISDERSAAGKATTPLKRITAAKAHEHRILRALEDLEVPKLALPRSGQGKRGVKSRVRKQIGDRTPKNPDGLSDAQFEKAWNAALKSGVICTS